ncbi:MAG: DUF3098 domain-containing protein [Clostridium sp.]|nr:DUF3098 domain-containing protein [Prevotella sp.]MCM1428891.1 DUF3098 domain-containing protein [Clostridium sp.]MCM1475270.1 DUF3098 domain-containing protein [Muribaculaceae bacterium]
MNEKDNIIKMDDEKRPFQKINFILMSFCIALIVIGFVLMCGSGSSVERGFNPDIFSFRRIVLGPAMAFIGFLAMAFAILWQPKKKDSLK